MYLFRYIPLILCLAIPAAGASVAAENAKAAPAPDKSAAPAAAGASYRIHGVLDPDRDQMVVFALKVPRDWQVQQTFRRQWGSTKITEDVRNHAVEQRLTESEALELRLKAVPTKKMRGVGRSARGRFPG